jgi:hypothetical protein
MSYRDDLRVLRAYCRKLEGREVKEAPINSLQGRKRVNQSARKKREQTAQRVSRWKRRHKKKWAAYMRDFRNAKRLAGQHLSALEGESVTYV